ncbi:hypothetical protein [Szabonella alba]|uniref:Uncharacterized protein n=1 Tax=Szabonella alba TaxID=2804194 RepID=A0A8K0V5S7_9RHOB|nr:hypothetical protein [Szabonella alba]MBL4915908.1 hypothetical protein [Szabonella alba]
MAAAVILLGLLGGLASAIAALLFGAPLWVVLLVYPLTGLIAVALLVAFVTGARSTGGEEPGAMQAEA